MNEWLFNFCVGRSWTPVRTIKTMAPLSENTQAYTWHYTQVRSFKVCFIIPLPTTFCHMFFPTTGSCFCFLKCHKNSIDARVHTYLKSFMSQLLHNLKYLLPLFSPSLLKLGLVLLLCEDIGDDNHNAILPSETALMSTYYMTAPVLSTSSLSNTVNPKTTPLRISLSECLGGEAEKGGGGRQREAGCDLSGEWDQSAYGRSLILSHSFGSSQRPKTSQHS